MICIKMRIKHYTKLREAGAASIDFTVIVRQAKLRLLS